jgi:hypothetical protein
MKCCNPTCQKPFDHREGRLVRFSRKLASRKPCEDDHLIEHFWLCGKCSGLYVFEYNSGMNIKIRPRDRKLSEGNPSHFVTAA